MKNLKKVIASLAILLINSTAFSQAEKKEEVIVEHKAPSLQVGLSGVSFGKGNLDSKLVLEIIAEKQKELKTKLVENMILSKVFDNNHSSGMIYNYTSNVLSAFLSEPNSDIRTRIVLENTVNAVFVYAFANQFFRNEIRKIKTKQKEQKNNDPSESIYPYECYKDYSLLSKDPSKSSSLVHLYECYKDYFLLSLDNDSVLYKIESTSHLSTSAFNCKSKNEKLIAKSFVAMLLDLSSEVLRENEELKKMGIMRIEYSSSYSYFNNYLKFIEKKYHLENANSLNRKQTTSLLKGMPILNQQIARMSQLKIKRLSKKSDSLQKKITRLSSVIKASDRIKTEMKSILETYINKAGIVAYLFKEGKLMESEIFKIDSSDTPFSFDSSLKVLKSNSTKVSKITAALDSTIDILAKKFQENNKKYLDSLVQKTIIVKNFLKRLESISTTNHSYKSIGDIILVMDRDVIPHIENLVVYNTMLKSEIGNVKNSITNLSKTLLKNDSLKINQVLKSPFYKVLSKIYDFDKKSTYIDYINLLPDLENIFGTGSNITYGLSIINSFIKDYTITKKDENGRSYMNVDVESFVSRVSNMKLDRLNYFDFIFTVGANTANFFNTYKLNDSTLKLKSYSYVGEKIGIKYKIINHKWMAREPGDKYRGRKQSTFWVKDTPPKEPIVSDWHILVYGSGILYNLAGTGTTKNFNKPLYGLGLGVSFYNNLDLNVSVGSLFSEWAPFWNIGFDIQFTEYLSRLSEKRRQNKNKKLIAKSAKNRK